MERIDYLIMEKGTFALPDGRTVEVGEAQVALSFVTRALATGFDSAPLLFTHAQTYNGPSAIVTRQRDITATSFRVRVQEEEAGDGIHSTETVGYVALGTVAP